MNKEEFEESLSDFLEEKTYIVAYRSNYDSAREFNNELINYIKQLEDNWNELKKENEKLKRLLQNPNDMTHIFDITTTIEPFLKEIESKGNNE